MFADSLAAAAEARVWDVCVIGSGPAGITLALELGARGRSVLLLEAGPEHYDEASQKFYEGEFFGPLKFPLDVCRLRYYGGSANHWGGFCRPLDEYDFLPKVPGIDTAWPIRRADLDPYLARASRHLDLSEFLPDEPLDANIKKIQVRYSPPTNVGLKYRETLQRSDNVSVALNAAVVDLVERDGAIVEAEVRDPANGRHAVRARRFVLCAGGIENSRLLLWANQRNGGRVVREPQALGRYWMEHPHFTIGEVIATTDLHLQFHERWNIAWMAPTGKAIVERGILNCGLRLMQTRYEDTKKLIADLGCVAPDLGRWAMRKLRKNLVCGLLLRAAWEQAPRPWNRVTLAHSRDAFGMPRVDLHWRLSDFERRSVRESAMLLGQYLIDAGLGRVRLDPWVLGEADFPADDEIKGNHHMGGTRMSSDPRRGVVDADCRVHGSSNLYVCGSSVFPSAGHANPTLTIVQLACRLAEHLSA